MKFRELRQPRKDRAVGESRRCRDAQDAPPFACPARGMIGLVQCCRSAVEDGLPQWGFTMNLDLKLSPALGSLLTASLCASSRSHYIAVGNLDPNLTSLPSGSLSGSQLRLGSGPRPNCLPFGRWDREISCI